MDSSVCFGVFWIDWQRKSSENKIKIELLEKKEKLKENPIFENSCHRMAATCYKF
jgi:hypothetical protein